MDNDNELKDWRGHVIKVGTPVAYVVSKEYIKEGEVVEVGDGYIVVRGIRNSYGEPVAMPEKLRKLTHFARIVVLPRTSHEAPHE